MTGREGDITHGVIIGADFSRDDFVVLQVAVPIDTLVSYRAVSLIDSGPGSEFLAALQAGAAS